MRPKEPRRKPNLAALEIIHGEQLNNHPNIQEMRKLLGRIRNHEEIKSEHIPHLQGLAAELSHRGHLKEAVEVAEIALWKIEEGSQHKPEYVKLIEGQNHAADIEALRSDEEGTAHARKQYESALERVSGFLQTIPKNEIHPLVETYYLLLSSKLKLLEKSPDQLREAITRKEKN